MKTTATITSKGQITIPAAVRRELGLESGDTLEFECRGNMATISVAKPRRSSFGALQKYLPDSWRAPSIEDMDQAIARHLRNKHSAK